MNRGFTLAEVLITIGIIGIVAAMTFPILIKKHRKTVSNWKRSDGSGSYLPGSCICEEVEKFYNKYFNKYLKTHNAGIDDFKDGTTRFAVYFPDGSGAKIEYLGHDWLYCINAGYLDEWDKYHGSNCFKFGFYPEWGTDQEHLISTYVNKGIEPYINSSKLTEDGNRVETTPEDLYSQKWYAKAIQLNNWTIPDDYPVKY